MSHPFKIQVSLWVSETPDGFSVDVEPIREAIQAATQVPCYGPCECDEFGHLAFDTSLPASTKTCEEYGMIGP